MSVTPEGTRHVREVQFYPELCAGKSGGATAILYRPWTHGTLEKGIFHVKGDYKKIGDGGRGWESGS